MGLLLVCPHCGDRIGVYEPVLVIGPDGTRTTSLAREPDLPVADRLVFHARCEAGTIMRPRGTRSSDLGIRDRF